MNKMLCPCCNGELKMKLFNNENYKYVCDNCEFISEESANDQTKLHTLFLISKISNSFNVKQRDQKRIPQVIKKLEELWVKHPDLRFGQMFYMIIKNEDMFNIEDDKLIELINNINERE